MRHISDALTTTVYPTSSHVMNIRIVLIIMMNHLRSVKVQYYFDTRVSPLLTIRHTDTGKWL